MPTSICRDWVGKGAEGGRKPEVADEYQANGVVRGGLMARAPS